METTSSEHVSLFEGVHFMFFSTKEGLLTSASSTPNQTRENFLPKEKVSASNLYLRVSTWLLTAKWPALSMSKHASKVKLQF